MEDTDKEILGQLRMRRKARSRGKFTAGQRDFIKRSVLTMKQDGTPNDEIAMQLYIGPQQVVDISQELVRSGLLDPDDYAPDAKTSSAFASSVKADLAADKIRERVAKEKRARVARQYAAIADKPPFALGEDRYFIDGLAPNIVGDER